MTMLRTSPFNGAVFAAGTLLLLSGSDFKSYCQRSLVCQWRQEGPKLFPCTLHARGFEIDVKGLHHIPTEKTIVFTVDTHGHASSSSPQLSTGSVMRQRGYLGQNCAVYAVSLRDGKESKFLRSLFGFFDDQGSVLFGYKYF